MRQPRFVKISSKRSVCFVLFMVVIHKAEFIMERSCQMIETNGKKLFRGEAALALAVLINSFGVVLMLYSGALILSLMIMRKELVTSYLFSFAVGFVFSELLDVHELWINVLPSSLAWSSIFHNKLRAYLHRNSAVKPLSAAHCPYGPVPPRAGGYNKNSLSQNKDRL